MRISGSRTASSSPASVPPGQRYLQKNGVSATHMGSTTTRSANTAYLTKRSGLSARKRFALKKGILFTSSCRKPKGHRSPQTALPSSAPKKIKSPAV